MAVCLDFKKGFGCQKTIAANLFPPHNALEQAGTAPRVDLMEGGDRRQRIADYSPINRHKMGVSG
jgi:hypothetical protein